ncbi:MAG: hypothetical protein ACLU3I_05595 [Acutalibacteraceae bacterium]
MRLRLPNGRELSYVKPRVDGDDNITYEGTIQSSGGWGRIESYGPKFVENIVQAKLTVVSHTITPSYTENPRRLPFSAAATAPAG